MRIPKRVLETKSTKNALIKKGLLNQYKKAKRYFLTGRKGGLDFKERKPKGSGVRSFRINRQHRAIGFFDKENDFIVTMIDNHQEY